MMLKVNPRPVGCKKLTNEEGYRIRVGNYRILYTIDDTNSSVNIYKIAHRKDVLDEKK
jgi:mRNA interferase RelE/StbE